MMEDSFIISRLKALDVGDSLGAIRVFRVKRDSHRDGVVLVGLAPGSWNKRDCHVGSHGVRVSVRVRCCIVKGQSVVVSVKSGSKQGIKMVLSETKQFDQIDM